MSRVMLTGVWPSFLAIAAGFTTMAALEMVTTVALTRIAPRFVSERQKPRLSYMLFNLAFSAAYAAIGGWVAARLVPVPVNPLPQVLMLALVVLVMGALSALQLREKQPGHYQSALTALTPMAVLAGGLVRLHQLGFRW